MHLGQEHYIHDGGYGCDQILAGLDLSSKETAEYALEALGDQVVIACHGAL